MSSEQNADIARRSVSGSAYSVASSAVTLTLGFVRALLMARLLLPEAFGIATLALFYLNMAGQLSSLGIDNALIHRKEVDEPALRTYFTMRLILILISLAGLAALMPLLRRFYPQMALLLPVLFAYMGVSLLKGLNTVQMTILSRELAFRKLAITDVFSSVAMTIVGPVLAWQGFGVWSIVAEQFSGVFVRFLLVWLFYRAWRPALAWDRDVVHWLWHYGVKLWTGSNLVFFLDRFDDWWIGSFLGSNPLGFYSRAYEFAGYPRRVVGNPLLSVFFPVFARLQDDRPSLSRAFFRTTSLMVRLAALLSLLMILTAPEFITLFLGERWLPMRFTFQLLIIYTLLDPLSLAASNLLAATGYPGAIARIRAVQLVAFVPAVIILGPALGIDGVALAADLMVLTGAFLLFRQTTTVVDYSHRALWFWPMTAMLVTAGLVTSLAPIWAGAPAWFALGAKGIAIFVVYVTILWLAERRQLLAAARMLWNILGPRMKTIENRLT